MRMNWEIKYGNLEMNRHLRKEWGREKWKTSRPFWRRGSAESAPSNAWSCLDSSTMTWPLWSESWTRPLNLRVSSGTTKRSSYWSNKSITNQKNNKETKKQRKDLNQFHLFIHLFDFLNNSLPIHPKFHYLFILYSLTLL